MAAHEDDMAAVNPLWRGAFQAAAHLSEVKELNMFKLKENAYDIATAEHVFESATQDREEYKSSLRRFFRSVKPGGIVHMAYVVGSEGYTADGKKYPAYPVMPDEVAQYASDELTDIQNFFTSASGQMREKDDAHGYKGLGVLVGIRK
jgi:predicted SAM-dependent methyltransferase